MRVGVEVIVSVGLAIDFDEGNIWLAHGVIDDLVELRVAHGLVKVGALRDVFYKGKKEGWSSRGHTWTRQGWI
ncbi:hypothetical protein ACFXTH_001023 [Malus domestica]